jgi:hypothetical protein
MFVFASVCLSAQTTLEEYNYITKGYKIQMESGLDMKKGYLLQDLKTVVCKSGGWTRTFNFKNLIRIRENKVCAIMVEYIKYGQKRNNQWEKTYTYFCIPTMDSSQEIWDLTEQKNTNLQIDLAIAYSWALTFLISDVYLENCKL